jgi:methylmalonyl-CoA mutase, C-terminal domain
MTRPVRVLVAKPGLDGHDRGARIVAQVLRDAGCEVIYSGIQRTPLEIAVAAVDEDVDVVGLSILAGGHVGLTQEVLEHLAARQAECSVVVGGTIPDADVPRLIDLGCAAVFPVGTPLAQIVSWVTAEGLRDG